LIPIKQVSNYFINERFAGPASILSMILGLIISWVVFTFYSYLEWRIGSKKVGEYKVPRWTIGPTKIIWFFVFAILLLFILFFSVSNGLFQAVIYILFFVVTIFIFSLLISLTKARYEYIASKDAEADRIFRTLEKNKLVRPGISIYANEPLTNQEIKDLDVRHLGIVKKIKLQTVSQPKEHIEVILSNDCRELIKVLKKHKIENET